MAISLAIFDFDGTLADSYPIFCDSLNILARKHRFREVSRDDMCSLRGLSAYQILAQLNLPLWRLPAVLSDCRDLIRQRISEIKPFPGTIETLQAMADKRIELALATSSPIDNVTAVLSTASISLFSTLECHSTLFGKSHGLRRILKKTTIDAAQTIYIGNELETLRPPSE